MQVITSDNNLVQPVSAACMNISRDIGCHGALTDMVPFEY